MGEIRKDQGQQRQDQSQMDPQRVGKQDGLGQGEGVSTGSDVGGERQGSDLGQGSPRRGDLDQGAKRE